MRNLPGEFEQIVLLAILRLKDGAYGVPIRAEIQKRTRRSVSIGALYSTLDRLAHRKFAGVPAALRTDITSYYAHGFDETASRKERKRANKIRQHLAAMNGAR